MTDDSQGKPGGFGRLPAGGFCSRLLIHHRGRHGPGPAHLPKIVPAFIAEPIVGAALGAVVVREQIHEAIRLGSGSFVHGHTFGRHPICRAAAAVLDYIEEHQLVQRAGEAGGTHALPGPHFILTDSQADDIVNLPGESIKAVETELAAG